MGNLKIENYATDRLTEYSRNSREHSDDQIDRIAASIREFGFTNPLLVDADGVLIAGHGRLKAARRLGMTEVPVIVLGYLTDAQRRAYVIADNKLAESSTWDEHILAREIAALQAEGYDLNLMGFDESELASVLIEEAGPGLTDEDDVPDEPHGNNVVSRLGDIWLLGGGRLMCGDSLKGGDLERLLSGELADMMWTDPPYNVDYTGKTIDKLKIDNDAMSSAEFYEFLCSAFKSASAGLRDGAAVYVAHASKEIKSFMSAAESAGLLVKQTIVWVKNTFALGRQDYQWQHEPILYGWKAGAAHRWYGPRNISTVLDYEKAPEYMSQAELVDFVKTIRDSAETSVLREKKPTRNGVHPTMKPVSLVTRMIKNSSPLGGVVLDLFGGSGSTLIACEKSSRRARLMEKDPRYSDVIIRRWQEYTGEKAILLSSGETFDCVLEQRRDV